MVIIPIRVNIYIDTAGTKETRTITRAELVAIHTALTTFAAHDLFGIYKIPDIACKPYGITLQTLEQIVPGTTATICSS